MPCHGFCGILLSFQLSNETECPKQYWISALHYLPLLGTSSVPFFFSVIKPRALSWCLPSPILQNRLESPWLEYHMLITGFPQGPYFLWKHKSLGLLSWVYFSQESCFLLLLVENSCNFSSPTSFKLFLSLGLPHSPLMWDTDQSQQHCACFLEKQNIFL